MFAFLRGHSLQSRFSKLGGSWVSAREGPIKYNNNGYLEQLTCASPTVFKCTYFQDSEHTTHTRTHTHTHTQGTGTEEKVFGKRKIFIEDFKRTGMCQVYDLIPFSFLAPSYHCALGDWSVCCLLIGGMSPNSVVHRHFNSKADTLEICDHDHVTTSMKGFTPGGLSRLFSIIFVLYYSEKELSLYGRCRSPCPKDSQQH